MPPDPPGQILDGRYEVGVLIGVGGMGEVRTAFDRRLQRDVAIKFLRVDLAGQDEVRRRFETEARSAARIGHPGAVTVFDHGESDGVPYLVMELLSGRTLADRLAAGETLAVAEVQQIGLDVLGALDAAHGLGVLHRDVKPGNLLYTEEGGVKLADFGIAKTADAMDHTATGELLGTAAYMAPERLHGEAAAPASDIYSVGVVLYEALAGRKPFGGDTPIAVAYAMHAGDHRPIDEVRPGIDRHIATAITRALAPDPAQRFGSAAEMAAVLRSNANGPTSEAPAATARMTTTAGAETTRQPSVQPRSGDTRRFSRPATADAAVHQRRHVPSLRRNIGWIAAGGVAAMLIGLVLLASRDDDTPGDDTNAPTITTSPSDTEPLPEELDRAITELERLVKG